MKKIRKTNKKRCGGRSRNHDGFLKSIFSIPDNLRALLGVAQRYNRNLADMLAEVDLTTLEEIPEAFNQVEEHGEADLAFKVKGIGGEDVFFGILLEHKSSPSNDILSQLYRYTFQVMVDKSEPIFVWMPTKAIIIYNGVRSWDPLANYRKRNHAGFQGKLLPFELAFVNLAELPDDDCAACENAEAAIGMLTLKHAFSAEHYENVLPEIERKLSSLSRERAACIVHKIELYLGEYISRKSLEVLKMAFKSIGQRLGFVSAGDERRAAERKIRRLESALAAKDTAIATRDAAIAEKDTAIASRDAAIAEKDSAIAAKDKEIVALRALLKSKGVG